MGLTSLPTKTDGSLGRVKSTLPDSDPSPDLDYYVTAAEHEAIKTAVVDIANEVGLHDGSTPGSINSVLGFSFASLATHGTLPARNAIVAIDSSGTGTGLNATLPAPSAGRVYLVFKVGGSADEFVTLVRYASEKINGVTASHRLADSDHVGAAAPFPPAGWIVCSDGIDWFAFPIANVVRHQVAATPPDDTTHAISPGLYIPGSTWADSNADKLYMAMCAVSLGNVAWHRVDAVDTMTIVVGGVASTLPSKDRTVFVGGVSGAVTLPLPDPTGRNDGRRFQIIKKNTGTHTITLSRFGSENINGSGANLVLPGSGDADYGVWSVVSDGADWWVTGGSGLV